jgi:hypothetical protein
LSTKIEPGGGRNVNGRISLEAAGIEAASGVTLGLANTGQIRTVTGQFFALK